MVDIGYAAKSLWRLFFPKCCTVCGKGLSDGEQYLCIGCINAMPRVKMRNGIMEDVEMLFAGSRVVESAVAYFMYNRHGSYSEILKDIKYHNRPQVGQYLASHFSRELIATGFFDGVDMVVPVPLYRKKMEKRGYNQSSYIADGVSAISGIPVVAAVVAVKPHNSQTSRSVDERMRNVAGVFAVDADVAGKRVLLVDDVITTGATLSACCDVLRQAGASGVRILSLALAESI